MALGRLLGCVLLVAVLAAPRAGLAAEPPLSDSQRGRRETATGVLLLVAGAGLAAYTVYFAEAAAHCHEEVVCVADAALIGGFTGTLSAGLLAGGAIFLDHGITTLRNAERLTITPQVGPRGGGLLFGVRF